MKTLIASIAMLSLLGACSSTTVEEECTYDVVEGTKTCTSDVEDDKLNELRGEIRQMGFNPDSLGQTTINGHEYDIMPDGTLVLIEKEKAAANAE